MSDQVNPNVALGIASSLVATGIVFVQFLIKRGNVDVEKERWLLESSKADRQELENLRGEVRRYQAEREQDKALIAALNSHMAEMEITIEAARTEIKRLGALLENHDQ